MKQLNLGRTIGIAANLGVIAGIVFLAIEIGQNQSALEEQNMLTRLSAREVASGEYGEFRHLLLENPDLLRVWDKARANEPLNELEKQQLYWLCIDRVYMQLAVYNRFEALGETLEAEGLARVMARGVETSEDLGCWQNAEPEISSRGYDSFVDAVEAARHANE